MFHLVKENIHLNEHAEDKIAAIKKIATALTSAGFVKTGYVEGMIERESQASTYLDIGIAIPHGTTTTRDLVQQTGVQVFCFPNGVIWGDDGEKAYLAIGIAASSDEHLDLLRHLTHVLSADNVEDKIKNITSADEAIAILTGKGISEDNQLILNQSALLLDIPVDSLNTLQAINASHLKQQAAINTEFITHVLDNRPNYLGNGVWVNDSPNGNLRNSIVISRTNLEIKEEDKPVKLLITLSTINDDIYPIVSKLATLAFNQQLSSLLSANAKQLLDLFTHPNTDLREENQ